MFGGEDSADTWCADAKLPDGLGANEGTETLEPSREVRRRESNRHSKHHTPDIPNLLLAHRRLGMFGGEDPANTQDVDAKLPDGLGACEGQETLEPCREVRRSKSKLQPKHHSPDIADLL